jgi:hypothetical protein
VRCHEAADLTGISLDTFSLTPTKNECSGHAEIAMRHNWLVIVVHLGPLACNRARAVGGRADGQPPSPTLSSPKSLTASAKDSVQKLLGQNATPALRLHQQFKRGQPEAAAKTVWANTRSPAAVSSESFGAALVFPRAQSCKYWGFAGRQKKYKTVGMPVEAGLPMLPTL